MLEDLVGYFQNQNNGQAEIGETLFAHAIDLISKGTISKDDAKSLFKAFDFDKSGGLTVQEIMIGLTKLMSGGGDEKMAMAFNAYDLGKYFLFISFIVIIIIILYYYFIYIYYLDGNKKLDQDEIIDMLVVSNYPTYTKEVAQAMSKNVYTTLQVTISFYIFYLN
jgi:hypothetical protein